MSKLYPPLPERPFAISDRGNKIDFGWSDAHMRAYADETEMVRLQKYAESDWLFVMVSTENYGPLHWKLVHEGLLRARQELEANGVRHSWIDPYVNVAASEAKRVPFTGATP